MLKAAKSSTVTPVKTVQVYTNKRTPPTILLEYIFLYICDSKALKVFRWVQVAPQGRSRGTWAVFPLAMQRK